MKIVLFFKGKSLIFFILTLVSCARPIEREPNRWYYGAAYSDSSVYVANYLAGDKAHRWLAAPILFKFTCGRDSLRVYHNGTLKVCPQVEPKVYEWKEVDGSIIFRIKSDHVTIQYNGGKSFKALNKSMI